MWVTQRHKDLRVLRRKDLREDRETHRKELKEISETLRKETKDRKVVKEIPELLVLQVQQILVDLVIKDLSEPRELRDHKEMRSQDQRVVLVIQVPHRLRVLRVSKEILEPKVTKE
jgi:hypothetical protein